MITIDVDLSMSKRIVNKILKRFEVKSIPTNEDVVFLTFDDGPEKGITEFVLEELDEYDFKATFFCRGDNAENHPELFMMLKQKGHSVGNHTFGHFHAYNTSTNNYLNDVERANSLLHTTLFRPPHGSLTLRTWLKLHRKYKIIYWAINSEDSAKEKYDFTHAIDNLKKNTKKGNVILFHFCLKHERETRELLPMYLKWLHEQGYRSKAISF